MLHFAYENVRWVHRHTTSYLPLNNGNIAAFLVRIVAEQQIQSFFSSDMKRDTAI